MERVGIIEIVFVDDNLNDFSVLTKVFMSLQNLRSCYERGICNQ